ncbi:MAG: NADPH-dependent F420 reductase [Myxococcota bacterium]
MVSSQYLRTAEEATGSGNGVKVGVLGSGDVAKVLARGFKQFGYDVTIGSREPAKLAAFGASEGIGVATFEGAAAAGQLLVLAVKGSVAESLVESLQSQLAGKVVIDVNNPIAQLPPVNGVLQFFTGPNDSLMERLQAKVPEASFVKAFSCVGNGQMIQPRLAAGRPTMFICGNSAEAKGTVSNVLNQFGWDAADMGQVESARAIEPLCQLWCVLGFRHNSWMHAFKLLTP